MYVSPSAPQHRCDGHRPTLPTQPQQLSSNVVFLQSSSTSSSTSFSANGVTYTSSSYSSSTTYYASNAVSDDRVSIDSFKVFDDLLQRAYDQLSTPTTVQYAAAVDEPLSAESAANNILGFIEARLRRDQAEGASPAELEERLNEGLQGFKKGFGEAKEQIDALGLLSPEIEEDIGLTYDFVLDGIDDLRRHYVTGESDQGDSPVSDDVVDVPPVDPGQPAVDDVDAAPVEKAEVVADGDEPAAEQPILPAATQQIRAAVVRSFSSIQTSERLSTQSNVRHINSFQAPEADVPAANNNGDTVVQKPTVERETAASPNLSASYGHYSYGQLNSFSFELETADGDKVTINVSTEDAYVAEYRAGSVDNGDGFGGFEAFGDNAFSGSRFQLAIDGELDDDELAAIQTLLVQVEDLSINFFQGDVESAYNQALDLGYNRDEIVGFSLNLRQVEVERFTAAYQQVSPTNLQPGNSVVNQLQPVGDFAKSLLDAVDTASRFGDAHRLIADLADQIDEAQPAEKEGQGRRYGDFVRNMLSGLPDNGLLDNGLPAQEHHHRPHRHNHHHGYH